MARSDVQTRGLHVEVFCHAFTGRHGFINVGSHLEMREREPFARTAQVGNPSSTLASARVLFLLQGVTEHLDEICLANWARIELCCPLLCGHGCELWQVGFGDAVVRYVQGHLCLRQ